MDLIIHPNYLPSTSQFLLMVNSKKIVFEINDHFLKQTYRNRTHIYGANGKLLLSIPVIHSHIPYPMTCQILKNSMTLEQDTFP